MVNNFAGKLSLPFTFDLAFCVRVMWFFPSQNLHAAAVAAAKSLQSYPTLCDPIVGSPPGSAVLGRALT